MVCFKRLGLAFVFLGFLTLNAADQVEVTADNFFADEVKLISILNGNVVVKKGDYDTLFADKVTITFDKNKQPLKYVATGNAHFKVLLNGKHYDGKGEILTYEPNVEKYTLEKNAYLHETESKKEIFGDKILVDRIKSTYEVLAEKGSKKPIKLIFEVD